MTLLVVDDGEHTCAGVADERQGTLAGAALVPGTRTASPSRDYRALMWGWVSPLSTPIDPPHPRRPANPLDPRTAPGSHDPRVRPDENAR